tara:strand:- start:17404 stop:18216 length:813 start_codon:yes stop_codon:yes gene_type:complete
MPNNNSKTILDKIVDAKQLEIHEQKQRIPLSDLKSEILNAQAPVSMSKSLRRSKSINLLAEIKKASPSKGLLCPDFDHMKLAHIYSESGAAGISILTDPRFEGELQHLKDIKKSSETLSIPVLRKDFILEEYQVYESRANNADCILLIVAILSLNELRTLHSLAMSIGMEVIVEVHNQYELQQALQIKPHIIGINNRDLRTFETDINTTLNLCQEIPENIIVISESGIHTQEHIRQLAPFNVDAILVGEALVTAENIPSKIESFINPTTS